MANSSNSKISKAVTGFVIGGLSGMLFAAILPGLDVLVLGGSGMDPSTFASMILIGILVFGGAGMAYAVRLPQGKYQSATRRFSWGALGFMVGMAVATAALRIFIILGADLSLIAFLYPWVNLLVGTFTAWFFAKKIKA